MRYFHNKSSKTTAFMSGKAFAIERIDGIYRLKELSKRSKLHRRIYQERTRHGTERTITIVSGKES